MAVMRGSGRKPISGVSIMKKIKRLISVSLILFFASASVYADDFHDGLDAYNKKDYKTAYKLWLPLAKSGDAEAQYKVGNMYAFAHGVSFDLKVSFEWHTQFRSKDHSIRKTWTLCGAFASFVSNEQCPWHYTGWVEILCAFCRDRTSVYQTCV